MPSLRGPSLPLDTEAQNAPLSPTNSHGFDFLPPSSGSHSTTTTAIKHSVPARAVVTLGLDCFAIIFFISGGKNVWKNCLYKKVSFVFERMIAVLTGKSDQLNTSNFACS